MIRAILGLPAIQVGHWIVLSKWQNDGRRADFPTVRDVEFKVPATPQPSGMWLRQGRGSCEADLAAFCHHARHLHGATMGFAAGGHDVPPLPLGGEHGPSLQAWHERVQAWSADQRQPRC